jgi:hypothetical protein
VIRRFTVQEIQIHIEYSSEKQVLYTVSKEGVMYSWNMNKILDQNFKLKMTEKGSYKYILYSDPINWYLYHFILLFQNLITNLFGSL